MTRRRVVLISPVAEGRSRAKLRAHGLEVVERLDLPATTSEGDLVDALDGAWGVVAGGEKYSAAVIRGLPNLRVIMRAGIGYENIDVGAANACGVTVAITPGANAQTCADFTVALMLACLRQIPQADSAVRAGAWHIGNGHDLFGSRVGIVGLGAIGRAVARRVAAFDCRILAVEPAPDREFCGRYSIQLMSLNEMLPQIDVLTLHAPLTQETRHLIGAAELRQLRPGTLLINTARGALVDEDSMIDALRSGVLGGAGLDTFEVEPLPPSHPLTGFPNVVLTGHEASTTPGAFDALFGAAVDSLVDIADGGVPTGIITGQR